MSDRRTNAKDAARRATRSALLDAATRLLFRSPAGDPLGALRPMDVVREAQPPRSNGAFYNIWPSQADFRRDLLDHVLSPARAEIGKETIASATAVLSRSDFALADTFRVLANLNSDGLQRHDTVLRLKLALWSRHAEDPEAAGVLAELYAGVTATLLPMYSVLLERSGRRMRSPYTVEHLATTLMGLAEGLHIRRAVQPTAAPDDLGPPPSADTDPDERWTFFASVAFTTFLGMTEPVPVPE